VASAFVGGGSAASAAASAARGKQSKQMELAKQAKERLQGERKQTEDICRKVEDAEAHVEQAWQDFYERDLERRQRATEIKKSNRETEVDINRCACCLHHINTTVARDNKSDLTSREQFTSDVTARRTSTLRALPHELQRDALQPSLAAKFDRQVESRLETQRNRSSSDLRAIQDSHTSERRIFDLEQQQWLADQQAECERVAAELEHFKASSRQLQQQMHADLISGYDLIQQLGPILDDLSAGRAPAQQRTGVRRPQWDLGELQVLLRGAIDDVDDRESLAKLRAGVADVRRQLTRSRQAASQEASVAAAPEPTSPAASQHAVPRSAGSLAGQGVDCARTADDSPAAGGPASPKGAAAEDAWDAEEFARDFCRGAGDPGSGHSEEGTLPLQHLDAERLRSVCLALLGRARMTAGAREAEKARLREEVAKELGCHSRVDQIRQLERDLASYEVRIRMEEERANQLGVALKCCSFGGGKVAGSGARAVAAVKAVRGGLSGRRPASAGPRARWP